MNNVGPQGGAEKKGFHPLVWVGLGCGALLVIAFVAVLAGGYFVTRKVQDFAEDMEQNPALTLAKTYAALNPEVEVVDADEGSQQVTLRNTKTGEELTVDLEDLKQGRVTFRSADEEVNLQFDEREEGGGSLTVTGTDGTIATFGAAAGSQDLPSWIPLYPGASAKGTYSVNTQEESSGVVTVTTSDSYRELLDFYREEFEGEGYKVEVNATSAGAVEGGVLVCTHPDQDRTVSIMVSTNDGESAAVLTYNAKN